MQAATNLTIAPLILRIAAFVIDIAILVVINAAVIVAIDRDSLGSQNPSTAVYVAGIVISAAYFIGFLAAMSATPGKLAMGLYVSDKQGARIRPDTAILRYIVLFVGGQIFVGLVVSLVLLFFDRQRRTLHDRIAGTLVLRRPQGGETPPPDLS
jgi:uncharacterized RDD family membrane protein YckC